MSNFSTSNCLSSCINITNNVIQDSIISIDIDPLYIIFYIKKLIQQWYELLIAILHNRGNSTYGNAGNKSISEIFYLRAATLYNETKAQYIFTKADPTGMLWINVIDTSK